MNDTSLLPERFWAKVRPAHGTCWEWTGSRTKDGYGRFHWNGRLVQAHRLAYETLIETIQPPELKSDHLCRNPSCVNPLHIEPVTNAENCRRGKLLNRETCRKGLHPWAPPFEMVGDRRTCLTCFRERRRRRRRELALLDRPAAEGDNDGN